MNPNWDLSYLYKGFDDPAFLADLKRFRRKSRSSRRFWTAATIRRRSWRSSPTSRRFLARWPIGSRRSAA